MNKLSKLLKSDKGDANCMSTVVFIFIAVILLAFIINLFGIISTKQLDHAADQMAKQIQLCCGINSNTDELFDYLCSQINGTANIAYDIDSGYKPPRPSPSKPKKAAAEYSNIGSSRIESMLRAPNCPLCPLRWYS